MTVIFVKAYTQEFGVLKHKFTSDMELELYKANPYVESCEIVARYDNLSYDEFNKIFYGKQLTK